MPQYILDQHAEQKKTVNIVVTQPRKLAASSMARRVCKERGWVLGGLVGYQVDALIEIVHNYVMLGGIGQGKQIPRHQASIRHYWCSKGSNFVSFDFMLTIFLVC